MRDVTKTGNWWEKEYVTTFLFHFSVSLKPFYKHFIDEYFFFNPTTKTGICVLLTVLEVVSGSSKNNLSVFF